MLCGAGPVAADDLHAAQRRASCPRRPAPHHGLRHQHFYARRGRGAPPTQPTLTQPRSVVTTQTNLLDCDFVGEFAAQIDGLYVCSSAYSADAEYAPRRLYFDTLELVSKLRRSS